MDVSSKANIADLQRYVTQLKSELEAERTRHKQIRREHLAEIRRMKDEFELEKQGSINHLRDKINNGKKKEIEQIREKLQKEKDRELRQVLRYKDEEMKTLQAKLTTEKDEVLRVAAHQRPNQSKRNSFSLENEQIQKLKQEVKVLKEKNQSLEDDLVNKSSAEDAKVEEIKRLKKEHEKELKRVVKETKQSTLKDLRHLHSLEKALETKGIEISKNETLVKSLEGLRKELDDKLNSLRQASAATTPRRLSLSSAISQTDDTTPVLIDINIENKIEQEEQALLVVTALLDDLHNVDQYTSPDEVKKSEDRDLLQQRKISDLNAHIKALESKITILKSENEALQHKKDEEQSSEDKIKKLKKRNSELAAIARRLDDKTKQLHTETSPKKSPTKKNAEDKGTNSHEIEQLKKVFARQRAKDLAEHARSSLAKDKELESLRKKCQDLSDQLAKHTAAAAEVSLSNVAFV
ncbi:uncharacterized protein LOC141899117 [Tubulanus polymorphus]|uniref:uncharacterized protein LOC141899117 n=1 Tax=Tubulanus polymorphus TaxID=672921 RepID=UPI003DA6CDA6